MLAAQKQSELQWNCPPQLKANSEVGQVAGKGTCDVCATMWHYEGVILSPDLTHTLPKPKLVLLATLPRFHPIKEASAFVPGERPETQSTLSCTFTYCPADDAGCMLKKARKVFLQTVTLHCLEGTLLSHHSVYHSAYQSLATLSLKFFPRDRKQGLCLAQGLRMTGQV